MQDLSNYFIYIFPLIVGLLSSYSSDLSHAGKNIPARPPGYVFGIVWFLLYILIGIAWVETRKINQCEADSLFIVLVFLLFIWPLEYGRNPKTALYILLITILVAIIIVNFSWNISRIAGYLISPLLAWLIFALLLNYTDVNNSCQINKIYLTKK